MSGLFGAVLLRLEAPRGTLITRLRWCFPCNLGAKSGTVFSTEKRYGFSSTVHFGDAAVLLQNVAAKMISVVAGPFLYQNAGPISVPHFGTETGPAFCTIRMGFGSHDWSGFGVKVYRKFVCGVR